jgi:N-acyl-D-amino-acid deacylase
VLEVLRERNIPVAITKDGRLVLARGYGLADVEGGEPVTPRMLFNLASCTKAFEGVAILTLVDAGKLSLDTHLDQILKDIIPAHGNIDPRVHKITVGQLLQHSAGLPRLPPGRQAGTLEEYVREALSGKLVYAPGTRTLYSNLGFLILRLVIERASGEDHEKYIQEHVLRPAGITDMRLDTIEKTYLSGEVKRYVGGRLHVGGDAPIPGSGCWLASSVDVVRFLTALDGTRGDPIISRTAVSAMLSPPGPPIRNKPNGSHNGLGWDVVQPTPEGFIYHKNGGIPGISTFMEHLPNGVDFFIGFNGSSRGEEEEGGQPHALARPFSAVKLAIERTARWPHVNYFEKYR